MIKVSNLTRRFGTTVALDGVTMGVEKGEIVGLLGPNGAGKTTMMRIITGYLAPTSGTASVGGYDVKENSLDARKCIGYLPETVPVYSELTVREYLNFTGALHDLTPPQIEAKIGPCMERTGVAGVSHRLIGHLSKGYRQRVGLAQALLHDPELLILDEPTVGLDPTQVVEIRGLIKELSRSHTVILSSHILPEVSHICSRVIIIDHGKIVGVGTQEELERSLKGAENIVVQFKEAGTETESALRSISGVSGVRAGPEPNSFLVESNLGNDIREEIFKLAMARRWSILELRAVEMGLEEVFRRLTRKEEQSS